MGASDYMVGNAPAGASYMAPQIGLQLGQMIANYPKDYYEGRQRQRDEAVANAFQGGIPTNPDGSPNTNAIANTLVQKGGGGYVEKMLPFLQQQQLMHQAGSAMDHIYGGGGSAPPAAAPPSAPPAAATPPAARTSSTASGPANLAAQPQAAPAAQQGPSVLQILAAKGYPANAAGPIAQRLGILPTDPVNTNDPQMRAKLGQELAQLASTNKAQQSAQATQQVAQAQQGGPAPQAPGQPAPQAAPGQPPQAPGQPTPPQNVRVPTPASQVPQQQLPQGGNAVFLPKGETPPAQPAQPQQPAPRRPAPQYQVEPESPQEQALRHQAQAALTYGAQVEAIRPGMGKAYLDVAAQAEAQRAQLADARIKRAQSQYDSSLKDYEQTGPEKESTNPDVLQREEDKAAIEVKKDNAKLTNEQKIAQANTPPGQPTLTPLQNKAAEDVQKASIDRSNKMRLGTEAEASQYNKTDKQLLGMARDILNQPSMYTGVGANRVLDFNRVRAAFGDQQAAMLQEALSKVTAQSVLSTINEFKDQNTEGGTTAGRMFQAEIDQVVKSVTSQENSLAGNRFLINVKMKFGELSSGIAQLQRAYLAGGIDGQKHLYLDEGYDNVLDKYLNEHSLLNPTEKAHPQAIGAPDVPQGLVGAPVQRLQAWEMQMGLKPGDWIRLPAPDARHPDGYAQIPAPNAQVK